MSQLARSLFVNTLFNFRLVVTGEKQVDIEDSNITAAERSLLQKVIRKSLVENKNDLEIQRKDPNCPLYSVKSFEELNLQPNLLKAEMLHIKKSHSF